MLLEFQVKTYENSCFCIFRDSDLEIETQTQIEKAGKNKKVKGSEK